MMPNDCTNIIYREAKCKFCRKELHLKMDSACPKAMADFWLTIAACDRCADYRTGLDRLSGAMTNVCRALMLVRGGEAANRERVEERCRTLLTELTRKYAELVCDFYRKTTVWEPGFPEMLFNHPEKAGTALGVYRKGMATI